MGVFRATQLALNALSVPLAGWLLDTRGPWLGIALPSSACAFACALRAFATGFSTLEVAAVFSGLSGAKVAVKVVDKLRLSGPAEKKPLPSGRSRSRSRALGCVVIACVSCWALLGRWAEAAAGRDDSSW